MVKAVEQCPVKVNGDVDTSRECESPVGTAPTPGDDWAELLSNLIPNGTASARAYDGPQALMADVVQEIVPKAFAMWQAAYAADHRARQAAFDHREVPHLELALGAGGLAAMVRNRAANVIANAFREVPPVMVKGPATSLDEVGEMVWKASSKAKSTAAAGARDLKAKASGDTDKAKQATTELLMAERFGELAEMLSEGTAKLHILSAILIAARVYLSQIHAFGLFQAALKSASPDVRAMANSAVRQWAKRNNKRISATRKKIEQWLPQKQPS